MQYENPVWHDYFADPFVLRVNGSYFAYGTGSRLLVDDGHAFPMLTSSDLIHWKSIGGALDALQNASAYWAPEVAQANGQFYLYYSAAFGEGDETHQLRVAIAERPEGPFHDTGEILLRNVAFSIDAHPFYDSASNRWFLFFANDFLDDAPFGTGLSVVELESMTKIRGTPFRVIRASQDWHVYSAQRDYKGRIWDAWHTVEGPFVVFRDQKYWCLYSGGRWSGEGYGVGFAVADHPLGPWRDDFAAEGPVVLRDTWSGRRARTLFRNANP